MPPNNGSLPAQLTLEEASALIDARGAHGGGKATRRRSPRKTKAAAASGETKPPRKTKPNEAAE